MGQVALGIILGYRSPTSCKVLVCSLTSGDMTCNGVTQSPAAVGTDRGTPAPGGQTTALYAAVFDVAADGATPYTVTQGANTDGGVIPERGGVIVHTNCDDQTANSFPDGAFTYIRHLVNNGKTVTHVKSDDPIYCDRNEIDDTGYTGHKTTGIPWSTTKQYDYAIVYAAQLGLLGLPIPVSTAPYSGSIYVGHAADRQWCDRNVPCLTMPGDHVFVDNAGWDNNAQAGAWWASAIAVWDVLYGAIMPPRLSGLSITDHTEGMHWSVDYGNLNITCIDRITQGLGGGATGTVQYGASQIADVLTAIDGPGWAKMVIIPNCIRYLMPGSEGDITRGANEPIADERTAEYAELMTKAVTGIQALGHRFFVVTPDHHNQQVLKHENATGAVTESFMSFTSGTGFGSQNHAVDSSLIPGVAYNGTTIVYNRPTVNSDYRSSWVHIEMEGTTASGVEEVRVYSMNENFEVVWSGAWLEGQSSNLPVPIQSRSVQNYEARSGNI